MGSEESLTIRAIFDHALTIVSEEERAAYLTQACDKSPHLRQRVDALLAAHAAAANFLESPAAGTELQRSVTLRDESTIERPGMMVGPYKLLEKIGEGGMGFVFMAEQTNPVRRRVALKVIKPGMDSRQVIARFEAERQALAMMDHPSIARVLEAGTTDHGRPYFVMELVRGIPITEYCDKNHLKPRDRLQLFLQVCHAVQHAHQKGVIHRDLKPTNVLVTMSDGRPMPKVIDFGIAKATGAQPLTDRTLFTEFHQFLGTPLYMSPEQAEMSAFDVDTRSDVYSLGVLLYELLTGTTPFDKKRFGKAAQDEVLRIIREEDPPKPSTRVSTLGEAISSTSAQRGTDPKRLRLLLQGDLDWIVMRALEKDRTRRYDTADGFARDVQRYLDDQPVEACPPSAVYRLRKYIRRNRVAFITVTSFALLLITATIASTWQAIQATRARSAAVAAEHLVIRERDKVIQQKELVQASLERATTAEKAASAAEALAHQAGAKSRSTLVGNMIDSGVRLQSSGDASLALLYYVRALRLGTGDPAQAINLRIRIRATFAEAHRPVDISGVPFNLFTQPGVVPHHGGPLKTKDNRSLRLTDADGLEILSPDGAIRTLAQSEKENRSVNEAAFSEDGGKIVTAAKGFVRVWDASTGQPLTRPLRQSVHTSSVAFSRDGSQIAAGGWGKHVNIWDAVTGALITRTPSHQDAINDVKFSLDGTRVLTASEDKTARIWDALDGMEIAPPLRHVQGVLAANYTTDGTHIVTVSKDGGMRVWDALQGPIASATITHAKKIRFAAFSADGTRILTASNDKTARIYDAASGLPLIPPLQHGDEVIHAAFSPDGKRVVTTSDDKSAEIWDAATGIRLTPPMLHAAEVSYAEFSPDGSRLVTASDDRTARIWDAASGKPITPALNHSALLGRAVFNSNGAKILTCAGDDVYVWDAATGSRLLSIKHPEVRCVAFSPDGSRIVSAGRRGGKLWDVVTGALLTPELHHDRTANCAAFSLDGLRVVTTSEDHTARIWDVRTGRPLTPPMRHDRYVYSATFSPDGARVATASWDYTARVWDTRTGQPVTPPLKHDSLVYTAIFSPDGGRLVTASFDRTARVWDVGATDRPLEDLEARAELLCASKLDDPAGVWPLTENEFRERWNVQTRRYPQDFFPVPSSRFAAEAMGDVRVSAARLAELGVFFAKRYEFEQAVVLFQTARQRGATVDPVELARAYWHIDQLSDAAIEFQRALSETDTAKKPVEHAELQRCLIAVESDWAHREAAAHKLAATRPSSRPVFNQ